MVPNRFEDGRPMQLAGIRRRHEFAAAARHQSAHLPDVELYPAAADPRSTGAGVDFWVGVVPRQSTAAR